MSDHLRKHIDSWNADAAAKCLEDPSFPHETTCYVCMGRKPICYCVDQCAVCGKEFGQYACQCEGPFLSAFDKISGERIFPAPDANQEKLAYYERRGSAKLDQILGRRLRSSMEKQWLYRDSFQKIDLARAGKLQERIASIRKYGVSEGGGGSGGGYHSIECDPRTMICTWETGCQDGRNPNGFAYTFPFVPEEWVNYPWPNHVPSFTKAEKKPIYRRCPVD